MNPWTIIGWILLAIPFLLLLLALVLFGGAWLESVYSRWMNRRWWLKTRHAPLPHEGETSYWKQRCGKLAFRVRRHATCYSLHWDNGAIWGGQDAETVRGHIERYHLHCPAYLDNK